MISYFFKNLLFPAGWAPHIPHTLLHAPTHIVSSCLKCSSLQKKHCLCHQSLIWKSGFTTVTLCFGQSEDQNLFVYLVFFQFLAHSSPNPQTYLSVESDKDVLCFINEGDFWTSPKGGGLAARRNNYVIRELEFPVPHPHLPTPHSPLEKGEGLEVESTNGK